MTTSPTDALYWHVATPGTHVGAIAIIDVVGPIDAVFDALHMNPVEVGQMLVRRFGEIDEGLVAAVSNEHLLMMPHGGRAILRGLSQWLSQAGIVEHPFPKPIGLYPEAASPFEAALLAALARASSPRAIDLLLAQPGRWKTWCDAHDRVYPPMLSTPAPDAKQSRLLNRFLEPPMVVAIGPSNIGKSTFLNTLAGEGVALVADEPGTTRDHVGALVDLDGLVVRYVDTPGLRAEADAIEQAACVLVEALLPRADLVLLLGDARAEPVALPVDLENIPTLRIGLRADLGRIDWPADCVVSALQGEGMAEAIGSMARQLVPDWALQAVTPWRFWKA